MTRIELGSADDWELQQRLLAALHQCGFVAEEDPDATDSSLPRGLTRFRRGPDELTVYCDAWRVDLAGSDELVQQVVASLRLS